MNVPQANRIAVADHEKGTVTETWPLKEAKANFPLILESRPVHCNLPCSILLMKVILRPLYADAFCLLLPGQSHGQVSLVLSKNDPRVSAREHRVEHRENEKRQ